MARNTDRHNQLEPAHAGEIVDATNEPLSERGHKFEDWLRLGKTPKRSNGSGVMFSAESGDFEDQDSTNGPDPYRAGLDSSGDSLRAVPVVREAELFDEKGFHEVTPESD